MSPLNMEIQMIPGSPLADVQAAFSAHYPFLMLEFFENDGNRWMLKQSKLDPATSIKTLVKPKTPQSVDISANRTVAAVLQDLSIALGVIVKMCRKSGKVWNAISLTESWTLARQDVAGQYISSLMDSENP